MKSGSKGGKRQWRLGTFSPKAACKDYAAFYCQGAVEVRARRYVVDVKGRNRQLPRALTGGALSAGAADGGKPRPAR